MSKGQIKTKNAGKRKALGGHKLQGVKLDVEQDAIKNIMKMEIHTLFLDLKEKRKPELSKDEVDKIYKYFKMIQDIKAAEADDLSNLTEEELKKLAGG